jgi:hypothetical protein
MAMTHQRFFSLQGISMDKASRGLNIIGTDNGQFRKVMVK